MRVAELREVITTDGWQSEWPTEPNTLWWFYGRRFDRRGDENPLELLLVEVWPVINGVSYVAGGHFFYAAEGAKGVFLRCIPPIPVPVDSDGEDNAD